MTAIVRTIATGSSGLLSAPTNCGTSAVQKSPTFTFSRSLVNPDRNMPHPELVDAAERCSPARRSPRQAARSARMPSSARYAAPASFSAENAAAEVARSPATPATVALPQTRLPAADPADARRAASGPAATDARTQTNVAGPGINIGDRGYSDEAQERIHARQNDPPDRSRPAHVS